MKTILIVDDREETVWALYTLLERLGHLPVIAKTAREALERLMEFMPDAIVLDLAMPGLDGYEFLDLLRADPRHVKTRVVVYTGMVDHIDVRRLVSRGVFEILIKSADADKVAACLAAV